MFRLAVNAGEENFLESKRARSNFPRKSLTAALGVRCLVKLPLLGAEGLPAMNSPRRKLLSRSTALVKRAGIFLHRARLLSTILAAGTVPRWLCDGCCRRFSRCDPSGRMYVEEGEDKFIFSSVVKGVVAGIDGKGKMNDCGDKTRLLHNCAPTFRVQSPLNGANT